jgi:hypothetical protein
MPPYDPMTRGQPMPQQGMPPEEMPPEEMPPEDQLAPDEVQDVPNDELSPVAEEATPEEQAQADRFLAKAWELIYDDNTFPKIVDMLEGGIGEDGQGDPEQGLAKATDLVVSRVAAVAEEAGEPVDPIVLYHAGADVFEDLAEVSRRGRIKDFSQDSDGLERAWFMALDMYRDRLTQSGALDEADAKAGLDQLQRADENGSLERIMRNLAGNQNAGQAGGEEIPPEAARRPKGFGQAMGAM